MCIDPMDTSGTSCILTLIETNNLDLLNEYLEEMKHKEDLELIPLKKKRSRLTRIQKQAKYGGRR